MKTIGVVRCLLIGMELCLAYLTLSLIDSLVAGPLAPSVVLMWGYVIALVLNGVGAELRVPRISLLTLNCIAFAATLVLFLGLSSPAMSWASFQGWFSWSSMFDQRIVLIRTSPLVGCIAPLCAILLWMAGLRMGRRRPDFPLVLSEFQFGFAGLLILQFTATQLDLRISLFSPVSVFFILFSLSGLYLARSEMAKGRTRGANRALWYGLLALSLTGVLLACLAMEQVSRDVVEHLLAMATSAVQMAAQAFFALIEFLAKLLPQPKPAPIQMNGPSAMAMEAAERAARTALIPEWVREAGRILVSSMWVILILVSLWRVSTTLLLRLLGFLSKNEGEHYERMEKGFRSDLRLLARTVILFVAAFWGLVMRLVRRFARRTGIVNGQSSIRAVYQQLLVWAAARGMGKKASCTPLEYLPTLVEWFPEAGFELTSITHHYMGVRYGDLEPSETDARAVSERWERVKHIYKKTKRKA